MSYFRITFLVLLLDITLCNAQILEKSNFSYLGSSYNIAVFKLDTFFLQNFKIVEFKKDFSEKKIFDSLARKGSYFACSASLFDSSCKFIGLFTNNYVSVNSINLNSGNGNFYMQPNGFFGVNISRADISSSVNYDQSKNYIFAIQSGPMLVINRQINPLFDRLSLNKNIRIAVGSYKQSNNIYIVFASSLFPVTFYEIASLLRDKFQCENALNLSGGQSSSFHMPSSAMNADPGKYPCNLIYIPIK